MALFGYNDWRNYNRPFRDSVLRHAKESKYDWSTGKNSSEYNHDYYEQHKEEILAKRKEARRNGGNASDSEKEGRDPYEYMQGVKDKNGLVDYAKEDSWKDVVDDLQIDIEEFAKNNAKHTEYDPSVLKNVQENNENVLKNIQNLTKTVQDYVVKNASKLSEADIKKLYKDLDNQIALEKKRVIDLDSKGGKDYVDGLLKGNKSSSSSKKSSSSSSSKKLTDTQIRNREIQAQNAAKLSSNTSNNSSSTKKDDDESVLDEQLRKYGRK